MIYEPQEDSFLLEKYVKKYASGKVLDMGTGSGIQAKAALSKTKDVLAVDINEEAVKKLKNAKVSDLFSNVKGRFDLIIFNPPYLPEEKKEDKKTRLVTTGGKYGYEIIERFLKDAKNYLNKDGRILIVFSSLTNKKKVDSLIEKHSFKFQLLEEKNLFFEKLYVYLIQSKDL